MPLLQPATRKVSTMNRPTTETSVLFRDAPNRSIDVKERPAIIE